MPLDARVAAYLRERIRRADTILFTGAGFSRGAQNRAHLPMPFGQELSGLIWKLCYRNESFDASTRLSDLFQVARARDPRGLTEMLRNQLSVDPDTIPEFYARLLELPWYRAYTVNVDDLETATARKYQMRRKPSPLSAVNWTNRTVPEASEGVIEVVHLNGVLDDAPDGVTFSPTQYAERLAGQDPLYAQCAADVLSRPVVFIGTPLDETPLWQHVSMRRKGPRTRREFRRESFLVTPTLERARRDLLEREFHVTHLAMTVEEFAEELLSVATDVANEGYECLHIIAAPTATRAKLPVAGDLSALAPSGAADYLLGRAPRWGDVRDGFAATRECDAEIQQLVKRLMLDVDHGAAILLTGTAGSGKSTAAIRLALSLAADNIPTGWLDVDIDISPLDLKRLGSAERSPRLIIIDDADRYGVELPSIVHELVQSSRKSIIVVSMRSGRGVDRVSDRMETLGVPLNEYVLPPLRDSDILRILDVLTTHNRLGVLKGRSRSDQVRAFRDAAGRQLIVALLEATSGRRFEDLIISEFSDLSADQRDLYGVVAVASSMRFGLTRDELLLSVSDASNATLAAIDSLQRLGLVVMDGAGELRTRHRVISEVLLRHLSSEGILADIVTGLAVAAATKVGPSTNRSHRHYRRLRSLINHDWLVTQIGAKDARIVYEEIEPLLAWHHHYWLQRGSFELEHGALDLAENFLNQAFSLAPDDGYVLTEFAYLQLKLAVAEPVAVEARRLFDRGLDLLRQAIYIRNGNDPHQYHIYGRQGLAWLQRGDVTTDERTKYLADISKQVEAGRLAHPRNELLRELYVDIQNERLGVANG